MASPKNIAGVERLARDITHTEKEIAYYLDRLEIIDETVAQGFEDQPLHREGFKTAIASLQRRKDRLVRRQLELERGDGMAQAHDHMSLSLAASSMVLGTEGSNSASMPAKPPASCKARGSDPLSDVLRVVKLTGSLFFLVDASFPWGMEVPPADTFSDIIMPRAKHIVSYHICRARAG